MLWRKDLEDKYMRAIHKKKNQLFVLDCYDSTDS